LTPITFDRRELTTIASQVPSLFRFDNDIAEINAGYAYLRSLAEKQGRRGCPVVFGNKSLLQSFDHIAVNCEAEVMVVQQLYPEVTEKISFLPNGYVSPVGSVEDDLAEVNSPHVLCVGRIEPNKNQLTLIWALRDLPIDILLVGSIADDRYADTCKRIANDRVRFLGPQPARVTRQLMSHASCHALPSFGETPGLVNLEAAALRCPIAVSNRGAEREYFGSLAEYCDPLDPVSIGRAVGRACQASGERRTELQRTVATEYTWDEVAVKTRDLYVKVIEDWKRSQPKS
jgi:glycosyltransferase involved in cell wall biosynthesis